MKVLGAMVMETSARLKRFSMAKMDILSPAGTERCLEPARDRDGEGVTGEREWMAAVDRRREGEKREAERERCRGEERTATTRRARSSSSRGDE
jgi:hypothetical protein